MLQFLIGMSFFFLQSYILLYGYALFSLSIQFQVMGSFLFQFWANSNNAAMKIYAQVFVWAYIFILFDRLLRVTLLSHMVIFIFNFVINCQNSFFQSGCTTLPAVYECSRFSSPHQYSVLLGFLIIAISLSAWWYFLVVLTCILLNDC